MKRYLALFGAAVLAVSSSWARSPPRPGSRSMRTGRTSLPTTMARRSPRAGVTTSSYGDVSTGGARGETLGDPNAVYSPMVPTSGPDGGVPTMPGAGDGLIGGVPIRRRPQRRRTPRRRLQRIWPARKAPRPRMFRSMPPRRPNPPPCHRQRRPLTGSARNTRPGTTLRSPTKTSARRRRTRPWCKRSTPTTTGSPARR